MSWTDEEKIKLITEIIENDGWERLAKAIMTNKPETAKEYTIEIFKLIAKDDEAKYNYLVNTLEKYLKYYILT